MLHTLDHQIQRMEVLHLLHKQRWKEPLLIIINI